MYSKAGYTPENEHGTWKWTLEKEIPIQNHDFFQVPC